MAGGDLVAIKPETAINGLRSFLFGKLTCIFVLENAINGRTMETNVLGKEIVRARASKRMTQEQLGKLVGLSKSSISKLENGRTKLTWEDASILMEAMGEVLALPSGTVVETEGVKEQKLRMLTSGIEWLANEKGVSLAYAYKFLALYKGLDFLSENYRYEQTLPRKTIINDMLAVCERNGGRV